MRDETQQIGRPGHAQEAAVPHRRSVALSRRARVVDPPRAAEEAPQLLEQPPVRPGNPQGEDERQLSRPTMVGEAPDSLDETGDVPRLE